VSHFITRSTPGETENDPRRPCYRPIASVPPATLPPYDASSDTQRHAHFRAHARKPIHTTVVLRPERDERERTATTFDLHIAGAGVELEEALTPGERVTALFSAPTLWDPLVITATVAWAESPRPTSGRDALGRPRVVARAGLAFEYAAPEAAIAMFEMLVALGFD
jgi:hypothetical protein